MLPSQLTGRARAQSHANIRKKILRSKSQDKDQPRKNSTSTSFRPKIERLLQQGKIQHIMNTDPHTKADLYYTTHINELEKELSAVKKSLGTMVMKSKAKQYNINLMKNDINKIEREQGIIESQSMYSKNKLSDYKEELQKKKVDLEEKTWKEKSYTNIKQRLIKEEDLHRARHNLKAVEYQNMKDEYKVLDKKYSELCQLNKELTAACHQAMKISREQADEKNQFVDLLNQEMEEKDILNDIKIEKDQKQVEINDLAPSMIEKEEVQKYMQILFTHQVVSKIIKIKSQNLMKQYEKVQEGYMHIRSNTNIFELEKIVKRMETQDEEYEKLLKKVSNLEEELLRMEKKMDKQVEKEHEILSMGGTDKKQAKDTYQGVQRDNYELLVMQKAKALERQKNDEILKKKLILWVNEYAHLYGIEIKDKEEGEFFNKLTLLATSIKKHK